MCIRDRYITEVKGLNGELKITMRPDANLKGENLPVILGKHKNKLTFSARGTQMCIRDSRTSGTGGS